MADLDFTIGQIRDEIKVDPEGKGKASIKGVSRLAGVDDESIRKALVSASTAKPSRLAQTLMDTGFSASDLDRWRLEGVPDIAVGEIVAYYAYDAGRYCTEESRLASRAFRAIGIRAWMQKVTGWEEPVAPPVEYYRVPTPDEIAQACLLPVGRTWDKRFGQDFYNELSRLTGLEQHGNARPYQWANLTDEWVYKLLPAGVREGVRKSRDEHGDWMKLHQFLSDDGIAVFKKHMDTLMIVMRASDTVNGVRRGLRNLANSQYQQSLFLDSRKDGKIVPNPKMID